MRPSKFFFLLFLLPLTFFLDLILYGMANVCPSCQNFSQWLVSEGAFSFPVITALFAYLQSFLNKSSAQKK